MKFKMTAGAEARLEAQVAAQINRAAQDAVNATSRAHHEQGHQDVEGRLRQELETRGLQDLDEPWIHAMSASIRESQVVFVTSDAQAPEDA